jgi:hypothetical protein
MSESGDQGKHHGDGTPADEPGPSDPSPESIPSEGDAEKSLPGVPEETEEKDTNAERQGPDPDQDAEAEEGRPSARPGPPPESIPGDSGEAPNPKR